MLRARKRSGPGKLFIWLAASLWRNSRPKECSHSSGDTGSSKAASTIVWTSLCARMRAGFGHPRPREYWERYGVWWSAWPTLRSIVRDRKTPSPNAPPAHSRVGSNLREADANASTRSSSPNTPTFWSYETEKTRPSVVRQAEWVLLSFARPRLTFSRISQAEAVQTNGLGSALWTAR